MNWKQGLFRIWIMLSLTWLVLTSVFVLLRPEIFQGFNRAIEPINLSASDFVVIEFGDDYAVIQGGTKKYKISLDKKDPINQHQSVHKEIIEHLVDIHNENTIIKNTKTKRLRKIAIYLMAIPIFPPVLVLMMGSTLLWIIRGFQGVH